VRLDPSTLGDFPFPGLVPLKPGCDNSMGYLKLEIGLSAMTKDQLADSLAYNSLKVCIF
jgi:hypothetical protein